MPLEKRLELLELNGTLKRDQFKALKEYSHKIEKNLEAKAKALTVMHRKTEYTLKPSSIADKDH